jgi:ABC-2 type transport system permease protein
MSFTAFRALVRRDLRIYFQDRRAVTMSFVAPIVIGSFFGYLFGGAADRSREAAKITVAAVDQDRSAISQRIVASLASDKALDVRTREAAAARDAVRSGKITIAAVIPTGFGENAARALFLGGAKPEIELLYDPSHGPELQMVRGMLMQHVMEAAAGARARSTFSLPFAMREEAVTARKGVEYNGMAHAFAGMCVQFILFMGIDAGLTVLQQRRTGLWKRLQASPVSRWTMVASRAASAAIVAVIIMLVVFGFARVVFNVRIEGSFAGFLGVCVAFALMTAAFGLLVSVLGKTPEATRGIAILVTLILVMMGGSWVPSFLFPQWLQRVSFAVPTRWAVDGLDGLVWRGWGMQDALAPIGALLAFTLLFGAIAAWRFRWES